MKNKMEYSDLNRIARNIVNDVLDNIDNIRTPDTSGVIAKEMIVTKVTKTLFILLVNHGL